MQVDITGNCLQTPRLILRAWQASDLQDFYEYASVAGVGEMAGWKHHESLEETEKVLNTFMADKNIFALELKQNHKVIGSIGLHPAKIESDLKMVEIGYVLSKVYWGQGLMPEAVQAVIQFCFTQLELDALVAEHFEQNDQSRRVIEKCGFYCLQDRVYYAKQLDKHFPCKLVIKNKASKSLPYFFTAATISIIGLRISSCNVPSGGCGSITCVRVKPVCKSVCKYVVTVRWYFFTFSPKNVASRHPS